LYYVDSVPTYQAQSYIRLDLGMTWRMNENTQVSVWGQNLLDPGHTEMRELDLNQYTGEVPRSFYIQVNMTF
jgi:outer membrane receptor protein involved in Fe transport